MKLSIAISPCPNDTYIFDALINKRILIEPYEFVAHFADVEELNKSALNGIYDISKLSFNAYFQSMDYYQLINSGGALGENCGPLLISKRKIYPDELADCKIATPGVNTTAVLLLQVLFPELEKQQYSNEYLFSEIEEVVLSDECDAGLVIHETRFTYQQSGLKLIADLGKIWEKKFSLPVPLGAIAIKRSLPLKIKKDIQNLVGDSIQFASNHPIASIGFIKSLSQISTEEIISKHINLYVNDYTTSFGERGKLAIQKLYSEYCRVNNIVASDEIFIL